jgi:hypothetical protein
MSYLLDVLLSNQIKKVTVNQQRHPIVHAS